MKSKRILLIGGNFYPEPTGIGKYNGEMMEWLTAKGHHCTVITTFPYYPFWKVQEPYAGSAFWYKNEKKNIGFSDLRIYRCPHYVPQKPSGAKRILSDFSFFLSALFRLLPVLFQKKYDHVVSVVPPFQLGLLALLYKWIRGGKVVYHIQDLQIDAAKELGMIRSGMLLRLMFAIECFILKKADVVSSISEGMMRRIKAKCGRTVRFFPNWVDTASFFPIARRERLKELFGFAPTDQVVLYSGAIGEKQGLDMVLEAARCTTQANVKFVICGSGPYKEELMALAAKMQLQNVTFLPVQPKEKFNQFLNMADVHLVLQKANADDLVMPSKLTTILSVGGLAIVAASESSSLFGVVDEHKMAITIAPEDARALANGVAYALAMPHDDIRTNARDYATRYLAVDRVMEAFFGKEMLGAQQGKKTIPLAKAQQPVHKTA